MTRPCFTLTFLLAALAGYLMPAGTALCHAPAEEDYVGPGYYRTCPFTEEDTYRDQDTQTMNQANEDELNQDLAGRAVVAVLKDPATNGEDVPSQTIENELDEYADQKAAEQAQTVDDPWAYARYGYDYHYGSGSAETNETASEDLTESETASEDLAEPATAADPWQNARDGYDYDYSSSYSDDQQEADDDSQTEFSSDYGIYYGDPCSEELDDEADHEQAATESVAETEPVDDSWKAARYHYIYGMQGNDDVADVAEETASEYEYDSSYDEYQYDAAYGDAYSDAEDAATTNDEAVEEPQQSACETTSEYESEYGSSCNDYESYESPCDDYESYESPCNDYESYESPCDDSQMSDDVVEEAAVPADEMTSETHDEYENSYSKYGYYDNPCNDYRIEATDGAWYDTAGDNAEAVEADADESSTTAAEGETESTFDGYGYEEAYDDWYDTAGDNAEAVEADADETTEVTTTEVGIDSEPASDPYDYEDAYGDYEDAYGDYYDSSSDAAEAVEADVDEAANGQSMTTYPYPYGYGYEYEYDWQKPGKMDSAELSRPNTDPLGDSTMMANVDFGQIADLSQQIVLATVGSDLAETVRTGLTGVTDRLSALVDHTDLQQVWHDIRASVAMVASQDQQAANANVFMLEFLFDEEESATDASSTDESPWMLGENYIHTEALR